MKFRELKAVINRYPGRHDWIAISIGLGTDALILVVVFAVLIILLAVCAKATLVEGYDDAEPWEESIEYYVRKYGGRTQQEVPVVEITVSSVSNADNDYVEPDNGYVESGERYYYGRCWITHYCPCERCCGKSDGITASGAYATEGWTVACGGLPFGTLVEIGGHTYCVEDRGVGAYAIDIFVSDHQRALELGAYWADVWIVD